MVVAVIQGSVRSERMGARVARWVVGELGKRGHEAVLVDTAKLELPLIDKMWKEIKDTTGPEHAELRNKLRPLAELFDRVDGFAICSAEYNHAPPPALINLMDHFLAEYAYRPSAIVCYSVSQFGGVRAAMQLRSFLAEVGLSSIPSLQPVPNVAASLSEEGVALTQDLAEKAGKFFDEFDWYMTALKLGREAKDPRKV